MYAADSNFFNLFSFEFIKGDAQTCINKPGTVVITENMANKLFGTADPLGKSIQIEHGWLRMNRFEVTGVIKDIPDNSHFSFNYLFGLSNTGWSDNWDANQNYHYTYILTKKGINVEDLNYRINRIYKANRTDRRGNMEDDIIYLQKLTDIHLRSRLTGELSANSDIKIVYSLSVFAFFILTIVCINFMNLMTARSASRSLEVGMRKVLGATRKQLIKQFLSESVMFSLIGFIFSIIMVFLLLPVFNKITGSVLSISNMINSNVIITVFAILFITGIIAGSYPALYLSSFKPVVTLRGALSKSSRNKFFGKALIIFQFTISVILIAGTMIFYKQLDFMRNKNLGFEKKQILIVHPKDRVNQGRREVIKNAFLQNSNIIEGAISSSVPGATVNSLYAHPEGYEGDGRQIMKILAVDYNFLDMYKIELLEGRKFSPEFESEIQTCIINETAVKSLGWEENAIGKIIRSEYHDNPDLKVIGVIKDFHQYSLTTQIEPMIIYPIPGDNYPVYISLNIKTDDVSGTISFLKNKMQEFEPGYEFEYFFLDENFDSQYRKEEMTSTVFSYFSAVAIFLACLGLIGLAAYMAEQGKKEISIRKILGAAGSGLVLRLSR